MRWPPRIDASTRYVLRHAAVPSCLLDLSDPIARVVSDRAGPDRDGLSLVDLTIDGGRIARIDAASSAVGGDLDVRAIDLDGSQAWPCFFDMHTHLDKGHIWPRAANPDGTFGGALASAGADRARRWNADDVTARMSFALRCAYAHGTAAIRTHLDSIAPQHRVTWPAFAALRDEWCGRIDLQAVSIILIEYLRGSAGDELADVIAGHGGTLGAVVPDTPMLASDLDRIFRLAIDRGLDLDFHADETGDASAAALRAIAGAALRHRFEGRVVVGHCCSLALQPDDVVGQTLDLVAESRVAIVSLPMCNLFLQDRVPGRTPRWRGVTLLHEMRARGIPVAIASDNCRDPFHGYGDHDMLEVFREAVRIAHLDRPIGDWPSTVTATPAATMGLAQRGRIAAGMPADLVLFNARGWSELLSRPQADRVILRAGVSIDATLPDYRELDPLMAAM